MIEHAQASDLEKYDDLAAKAAKAYSEYVHERFLFAELSKDMLAALKMEILAESDGKMSDAECDTRARASAKWKEFRVGQEKRLRDAGRAEIVYENAKRRWDTARSGLAIKRTEMERGMA